MGSTLVRDRRIQPKSAGRSLGVGDALGSYRLIEWLGAGGMGMVFVGEHALLGRRVALKVLHPQLAQDPDIIRRLFREARAINAIAHPNIVEIFDCVQSPDGADHLVMELLVGKDLEAAVEAEGPFPLARTLGICRQIASALAAAHAQGIIHRDLKPENVYLIARGGDPNFVKLLDFGLAKLLEPGPGLDATRAGTILGTPEYMSPEQSVGDAVDARSDIYSLAVLAYALLADRLPFEGDSLGAQRAARLRRTAPPLPATSAAGDVLPAKLGPLIGRCLALDPGDRCQSMAELLLELTALGSGPFEREGAVEPAPRTPPRRRRSMRSRRAPG